MTHRKNHTLFCTVPVMLAVALLSGSALTMPAVAQELPTGATLIANMIEAQGGVAALKKIKNRKITLSLDLGMGMTGKGFSYHARPNKHYSSIELVGMGTIEQGFNDGVAWELAAMMGPRLKEGDEKSMALREANFDGLLDWKSLYKSAEVTGTEDLEGAKHFKLVLTPEEGNAATLYVDAETYAVSRTDTKMASPMGTFELTILTGDYRPVDGIHYPHKSTIKITGMPADRVVTLEKVEHDVEIPEDRFNFPAGIQALVDKAKTPDQG